MMSAKSKYLSSLCFVMLLSSTLATCNASKLITNNSVYFMQSASNSIFFTTKQGKTVLCNVEADEYSLNNVKNMLKNNRIKNLDYILIFNYSEDLQNNVASISNSFNANKVCVFGNFDNSAYIGLNNALYSSNILQILNNDSVNFENETIKVDMFKKDNKNIAVNYNINGSDILQILGSVTADNLTYENIFNKDYEYLYAKNYKSIYSQINSQNYICNRANGFVQNVQLLQDDEILYFII